MTVQIEVWQLFSLFFGLLATLATLGLTFGSLLLKQVERRLDERFTDLQKSRDDTHTAFLTRFSDLDQARREEMAQWQRVERDLLALRSELPTHYVRREDYVRGQTVVEAKLDALALKLENLQLRTHDPHDRRRALRHEPLAPSTQETP